jgi:ribulose-5-phosphate 4-epimerase/fuculose-1-phosphate aldolase
MNTLMTDPKPQANDSNASAAFHPLEWQARVQLANCYRVFAMLGWTEMIYNHITVRLPDAVSGAQKQFLINPFGLHYTEVTPLNLIKTNVAGDNLNAADQPHAATYPVNPAGIGVHAAIHQAKSGAHCVMHTHTTAGVAVACTASGLAQNNFYSAQLHNMVAYHDFEGITIHPDELPRLMHNMADKPLLILRNHGLLAVGETLPLAFARLWTLQRACEIQLAQAALGPAISVPEAVAAKTTRDSFQFNPNTGAGQDVFDALVRLLPLRFA